MHSLQYTEPAQETYIQTTRYPILRGEKEKEKAKKESATILRTLQQVQRQVQTHLLGRNIKRDGPHINLDEVVCAGQDKEQTCAKSPFKKM